MHTEHGRSMQHRCCFLGCRLAVPRHVDCFAALLGWVLFVPGCLVRCAVCRRGGWLSYFAAGIMDSGTGRTMMLCARLLSVLLVGVCPCVLLFSVQAGFAGQVLWACLVRAAFVL